MTSWSSFVGMANVGWSIFNWKSIEFCILYSAHLILLISLHCICSIKGQFCKTWGQIFFTCRILWKTKYTGNWLHTKLCEIILWDIYTETRKMWGSLAIITKIKYNSHSAESDQAHTPLSCVWRRFLSVWWIYGGGMMGSSQSDRRYGNIQTLLQVGVESQDNSKIFPLKYFQLTLSF